MPSADAIVTRSGPISVPLEYTVPATEEIVPLTMRAHFDGTSAAGPFLPALQIVSQNGAIVATATTADSVAAGASADVTWFPGFLEAAASSGATGLFWPIGNQQQGSIDSTTYANEIDVTYGNNPGTGFYDTVVLDNSFAGAALAYKGDAHPTMIVMPGTLWMSDGTFDPGGSGVRYANYSSRTSTGGVWPFLSGGGAVVAAWFQDSQNTTHSIQNTGGGLALTPLQGLQGVALYGGAGVPTIGGRKGDWYLRSDGGAGTTLYQCTLTGAPGVATWAGIL